MIIGIIGNGFVGKATQILTKNSKHKVLIYDIDPNKCSPAGLKIEDLVTTDFIFIAVPTPMYIDGNCNISIVESVVYKLKKFINSDKTSIIIRSTVPVGTSNRLDVNFMPEFLTEKNWENDFYMNKHWIFGENKPNKLFQNNINELIKSAHELGNIKFNKTSFINNNEAEMIKYFKNNFLAVKVSFCNEIYSFCEKMNIDYDIVNRLVLEDVRIGKSHTKVPGYDGSRGYGGTCFPKDTNSLYYQLNDVDVKSYIIKSAIIRNEIEDRPRLDWLNNNGRSVTYDNSKSNILITMGSSHKSIELCKKLLNESDDTTIIMIDTKELVDQNLLDNKRVFFTKQNICDDIFLTLNNLDQIYHVLPSDGSEKSLDISYIGTKNLKKLSNRYLSDMTLVCDSKKNHEYMLANIFL